MFVDNNHAGNKQTKRSKIRFMIFVNMSLINWHCKRKSKIKTLVFGAEDSDMESEVSEHEIKLVTQEQKKKDLDMMYEKWIFPMMGSSTGG